MFNRRGRQWEAEQARQGDEMLEPSSSWCKREQKDQPLDNFVSRDNNGIWKMRKGKPKRHAYPTMMRRIDKFR